MEFLKNQISISNNSISRELIRYRGNTNPNAVQIVFDASDAMDSSLVLLEAKIHTETK